MVFRLLPPFIKSIIKVFEGISCQCLAQRRSIGHADAVTQHLALISKLPILAPECLGNIVGCIKKVLNRVEYARVIALVQGHINIMRSEQCELTLEEYLFLEYAKQHQIHNLALIINSSQIMNSNLWTVNTSTDGDSTIAEWNRWLVVLDNQLNTI